MNDIQWTTPGKKITKFSFGKLNSKFYMVYETYTYIVIFLIL